MADTTDALKRQLYANWSLLLVAAQSLPAARLTAAGIPAAVVADFAEAEHELRRRSAGMATAIAVGDRMPVLALAQVAEFCLRNPDADIVYGDEETIDDAGRFEAPELKPDWSPAFQETSNYLGRAVYLHTAEGRLPDGFLVGAMSSTSAREELTIPASTRVAHLRRIVLTKRREQTRCPPSRPHAVHAGTSPERKNSLQASIVIPTRDKAHLLADCLRSLERIQEPGFEVILVDNGSTESITFQYYECLRDLPNFRVIASPGEFNFSRLCNQGAAAATTPTLVFLNNDTVALDGSWLGRMLQWTGRPDVGAVGAKLLYPSLRIQHAGIVLGLKGITGHLDVGAGSREAGYLSRLRRAHEVSAVTAACLAVSRDKFDAVGGLDAQLYPVELNDIDLCLRLARSGWRTVMEPRATLLHRESASRGRRTDGAQAYRFERVNFMNAWGDRILDDPYLHPAFSLHASRQVLS